MMSNNNNVLMFANKTNLYNISNVNRIAINNN